VNKPAKAGIPTVKGYCRHCGLTGGMDCPKSGKFRTKLKKLDTRRVRRVSKSRMMEES